MRGTVYCQIFTGLNPIFFCLWNIQQYRNDVWVVQEGTAYIQKNNKGKGGARVAFPAQEFLM